MVVCAGKNVELCKTRLWLQFICLPNSHAWIRKTRYAMVSTFALRSFATMTFCWWTKGFSRLAANTERHRFFVSAFVWLLAPFRRKKHTNPVEKPGWRNWLIFQIQFHHDFFWKNDGYLRDLCISKWGTNRFIPPSKNIFDTNLEDLSTHFSENMEFAVLHKQPGGRIHKVFLPARKQKCTLFSDECSFTKITRCCRGKLRIQGF